MRRFLIDLWKRPAKLSPLAMYIVSNGLLYGFMGLGLYAAPASILKMLTGPSGDVGTLRVMGMMLGFIGWFYVMGGRTGATSFALSTVVDRLSILVFLGALVALGDVQLHMVAPFMILDPLLAVGALWLWSQMPSSSSGS